MDHSRHAPTGFGESEFEEEAACSVRWVGDAPPWTEYPDVAAVFASVAAADVDDDLWTAAGLEPAGPFVYHVAVEESGTIPALRRAGLDGAVVLDLTDESLVGDVRQYLRRAATADLTLVGSRAALRELRRRRPALAPKTALLPHPVDLTQFVPRRELDPERRRGLDELRSLHGLRERVVLCPALPRPGGGVDLAARCLELLRARGHDVSLVVLREDDDPRSWARSCAVLQRAGALVVDPAGHEEVALWYAAADVVCLPARNTAASMPARRAAAAGVPVLASEIEPYLDVVEDGVTGYLLPVDDLGLLVKAVEHVLSDDVHARRLGAAAREQAERKYSPILAARRLLKLWRACMDAQVHSLSALGFSRS